MPRAPTHLQVSPGWPCTLACSSRANSERNRAGLFLAAPAGKKTHRRSDASSEHEAGSEGCDEYQR
jgi:hypothetical protein